MKNSKLASIYVILMLFSVVGMIFGGHVASVLAQGTAATSATGTFTVQGGDSDSFKNSAKAAREGALRLIDWTVKGFLTKNTTETANAMYTDESVNGTQSLKGLTAIKEFVKPKIDSMIRETTRNSTGTSPSLSFKITLDTECKAPTTECIFKIGLKKQ